MGDVQDDLNVDEREPQQTPSADDTGSAPFPDPVIDEEPDPSQEEMPPVQAEAPNLPAGSPPSHELPPPPQHSPAPVYDGGFTPQPRSEYQPPPAQPSNVQFFSVEQLQKGVDEGVISQAQMFEQLQFQNKEVAKREALEAFNAQQRNSSIDQQLSEYNQLVPGWDQPGSPANVRANPEFQRLLSRGFPNNNATRLTALEATFGTTSRIKEMRATQTRTAQLRPTAPGVGRKGPAPTSGKHHDPLNALSLDEKRVYKSYIDKGLYKDWNEVRAEVSYAANQTVNRELREKHAAAQGSMR